MQNTHKFEAISDGVGGFNDRTISRGDIGCRLSQSNLSVQIHISDLDGGSYDVFIKPVEVDTFVVFQSNASETDLVAIPQATASYDDIRIVFAGLGVNAAPVITFTSFNKGF
jgi:hypothetical protein